MAAVVDCAVCGGKPTAQRCHRCIRYQLDCVGDKKNIFGLRVSSRRMTEQSVTRVVGGGLNRRHREPGHTPPPCPAR